MRMIAVATNCHSPIEITDSISATMYVVTSLVDDLASHLSKFLFFLVISQDSFAIPSIQDSCLKKQILTFWWYSCRQNLGWRGKKYIIRQDSCILEFLPDSFFSWNSCLIPFSFLSYMILVLLVLLACFFYSWNSCLISFFSWIWYVY
jgi:hypothetical protein